MPTIFAPERIPFTPTASGRQKSPRVGRGGPRLVERSPTPSPRFSSGLRRRSTLASVRSSIQDWLVHRRLRGGKSLLAWAAAAQGSSSVRRPLRLPFSSGLRRRFTLTSVRSSIRDWLVHRRLRDGKSLLAWAGAAQGSSSVHRPLRLPFPVGATTLHADCSALKHPRLLCDL